MLRYFFLLLLLPAVAAADWYPVAAVIDGKTAAYQPLAKAARPWRVCALLPHGKDKYWWGVSWGLAEEARRQGIKLGIYQAGGYEHLPVQVQQLRSCLRRKADAIILAAISAQGLDAEIARASEAGVPVIDLVNGVSSNRVAARSLVSFTDMADAASRYLLKQAGTEQAIQIAWLPGPAGAGWVQDGERGMRQALAGHTVSILDGGYAPPDPTSQMERVRAVFATHQPDYLLGNAVAAESAANFLKANPRRHTRIVAYYATEPVVALIRQGQIMAAPSDAPVLQARISVDLAVRILDKQPYARRVSPVIEVLDAQSLPAYDLGKLLPPPGQWLVQRSLPD